MFAQFNSSPARRGRLHRGFTLVEVLVAMGVIGVSVTALVSGITWGIKATAQARDNQFATQILTERMDTIRLYSHTQVTNRTFFPTNEVILDPRNASQRYTLTMSVTNNFLVTNYRSNLARVTLDLRWNTGGVQRQRTQQTYVATSGLQTYVN